MREHVHFGFFNILWTGISAIVVIKLFYLAGVWAANNNFEMAARVIGGLINNGPVDTHNEVSV